MEFVMNFKPDLTTLETKAQRKEYAKKKCRNRRELMAFLIDMNRFPRGQVFFPNESSGSKCLRKYRKKRERDMAKMGYRKMKVEEFYSMGHQGSVRAYDPYSEHVWVCHLKKLENLHRSR